MTQYLPPNLLALFAARDPIPYMPPVDKLPHEKKSRGYLGVANFLGHFEDPKDTPLPKKVETRPERLERRRREKAEQVAYKLEREIALWDPLEIKNATADPFRTLFVARINYDTSESKLRREFEIYGPIKKSVMIIDHDSSKPKGYAFIEYEHERDMHAAYKHADGKKIDGKRVLVDVERARTVKGWLPRRLGGGLGGTRRGGNDVNIKHSGREDNERERERYRLEREREDRECVRAMERNRFGISGGGGGDMMMRRRSRSRERMRDRERDRDRDRERDRDRIGRRSRSRSRDRKKRRDYDEMERRDRRDKDRNDRDRLGGVSGKKRRSKTRERDSPSSREYRERKRDRRDRDRDRSEVKERKPDFRGLDMIKIKEEPIDDGYPTYPMNNYQTMPVKREADDDEPEEKYRPPLNMFNVPPPMLPPPGAAARSGQGENGQGSADGYQQQPWWQ